uniref:Uncharacterized protein n=1 Tax=Glossina palpalis gambiensis TaxID=67801 RepID=A0A1B0BUJ8_9MUSC
MSKKQIHRKRLVWGTEGCKGGCKVNSLNSFTTLFIKPEGKLGREATWLRFKHFAKHKIEHRKLVKVTLPYKSRAANMHSEEVGALGINLSKPL